MAKSLTALHKRQRRARQSALLYAGLAIVPFLMVSLCLDRNPLTTLAFALLIYCAVWLYFYKWNYGMRSDDWPVSSDED